MSSFAADPTSFTLPFGHGLREQGHSFWEAEVKKMKVSLGRQRP